MKNTIKVTFTSAFEEDVYNGLTNHPKYLFSKYIYDKKGDKLFQDIMDLPEYYLTNCEYDILKNHAVEISSSFIAPNGFDLIEMGPGDGKKTKVLLNHLVENKVDFEYLPIDISQNALEELETSLKNEIPQLKVKIQQGTYFQILEKLTDFNARKKVIMMLGSNIGNLMHHEAIDFLKHLCAAMSPEDMLFIGFDQKKHPQTIQNAYNDKTGVTEAFNKNILVRINSEFNANFDTDAFMHWETYNPETGTAKSYLVSQKEQEVEIGELELKIHFDAWETIHTEISQKYDDAIVEWLADQSGLKVSGSFTDDKSYYKNYILVKL